MREFIRHPPDIPITCHAVNRGDHQTNQLHNISRGGLCFNSDKKVNPGNPIEIKIPIRDSEFKACGTVAWCEAVEDHYDIGIKFNQNTMEFSVRMVEQVCYIEQYRQEVLDKEGRQMSYEQAAAEWIENYAQDFPN